MKKLVTILTILVTILITASAYADITEEVYLENYNYWNGFENCMDIWKELEDCKYLVKDGRLYMKGGNVIDECWSHLLIDMEHNMEAYLTDMGAKYFDVHISEVGRTEDGRRVLWVQLNGLFDLNEIEEVGETYYGFDVLCYDRF